MISLIIKLLIKNEISNTQKIQIINKYYRIMADFTLEPIYERVPTNEIDEVPIIENNITWEKIVTTSAIMYTIMYFMFSVAVCITQYYWICLNIKIINFYFI